MSVFILKPAEVKSMAKEMVKDPDLNSYEDPITRKRKLLLSEQEQRLICSSIDEVVLSIFKQQKGQGFNEVGFVRICKENANKIEDPTLKRAWLWTGFAAKNICQAKLVELEGVLNL